MTIAKINGVNLYHEITGQGKAIVFYHGFTGSTNDWVHQVRLLSPRYQVITLDSRGHGKSAAPSREEDYSIPIFANDVFELLKLLDVKKCCLVGHSFGGFTALRFSLDHQDMLAGLILVDTSINRLL